MIHADHKSWIPRFHLDVSLKESGIAGLVLNFV